jgi:hypothetical protein
VAVWEGLDTLADEQVDSRNSVMQQGLVAWLEKHNIKIKESV